MVCPSSLGYTKRLQGVPMSEVSTIQVGSKVPDFKLDTYNPRTGDFGSVSLAGLNEAGKWTVLFFYPADFTFV